jgi:hypothetical protein
MPRNVAQWTGIVVTTLIVLGRDIDVVTALPFGIAAGALASMFVALSRQSFLHRIKAWNRTMAPLTSSLVLQPLAGWRLPQLRHRHLATSLVIPPCEPGSQPCRASVPDAG